MRLFSQCECGLRTSRGTGAIDGTPCSSGHILRMLQNTAWMEICIHSNRPLKLIYIPPNPNTLYTQEHAFESSQKYKEGKFIIELAHMIKENGWD